MNIVKELRKKNHLSQGQMGKLMGTVQQSISVLENKERVGKGTENPKKIDLNISHCKEKI